MGQLTRDQSHDPLAGFPIKGWSSHLGGFEPETLRMSKPLRFFALEILRRKNVLFLNLSKAWQLRKVPIF